MKTPIEVPGKNKRDTRKAALLARKSLNRPRGRPLKLTPSKELVQNYPTSTMVPRKSKKNPAKDIKSKRKLSNLEKLPTELIEKILLYCPNVDLARSSPIIAGKLSSQAVYTRAIMAAFSPTWEACYGKRCQVGGSYYNQPVGLGNAQLQSSILRCRWMSLPLLLKTQDSWVQKYALDRRVEIVSFEIPQCNYDDDENELHDGLVIGKMPSEYFKEDFTRFSTIVQGNDASSARRTSWDTYIGIAKGTEIPRTLLLGPWTEEKTKFLYWMVKYGARLEFTTSISGELALLGLKSAISAGDIRVIHLLEWAGLSEKLSLEDLVWALHNAGGDRLAVMELLIRLSSMSNGEQRSLRRAIDEFRDDAELVSDEESVAFITSLEDSQIFPWK